MPEIPIEFTNYLPSVLSIINMHVVISQEFSTNINLFFQYNNKDMIASIYSGNLKITDVTNLPKYKVVELLKTQENKTESLESAII